MTKKLGASQLKVAQQILQKRLGHFPEQLVMPLLGFTESLLRCEGGVNRKFLLADLENLVQQHDDPATMQAVAAQYLHTLEDIRKVIFEASDDKQKTPKPHHPPIEIIKPESVEDEGSSS